VRTRSGPFTLAQSITLEALEAALADNIWQDYFYAPDEALLERRAAILDHASEARLRTGQPLRFDTHDGAMQPGEGELLRAYSTDGRFLGILRWQTTADAWQPHKVLQVAPVEE
jgi:tRNA pseudouridine55 synthase